jgi:DNA primase
MDELRDRLTLSEVIGRRVKLTRAGREFKACCPFHHEKSPSFYVNDDKQFYHCFGCAAHGDVIGFVMRHGNLDFIEALEMLSAEAGMPMPQSSPQAVEQARKEKSLHALLEDTARFFESQLRESRNAVALQYLRERGVPEELIGAFRLGYAPEDGGTLVKYLQGKDYTLDQMVEAGVVKRSERGGEPYSFFRDRVMFPVSDWRGRVVAFGGRVLPEHLRPPKPGAPKMGKYINSAETSLFHKGSMLYSEAHARQAAADGLPVIVVEGYLDVMACFGAGYRGAVAPLGTALTEDQIGSLWKMIPADEKIPILCFDGDEAGRRAAARAAANILPLLKPYHSARIAFLPEGQDPDSLLKSQGRQAFAAVIDGAMPLADFLWLHHTGGRKFETPEARAGLAATLDQEAAQIPDRTVQQYYRQMFRDRLYKTFGQQGRKTGKGKAPVAEPAVPVRRPAHAAEGISGLILMATLINHPHIFDTVEESFSQLEFEDKRLDQLRQAVHAALGDDSNLNCEGLQSHLKSQGFEDELGQILHSGVYTHAGFARPNAVPEKILAGWKETVRFMHHQSYVKELRQAGQALAGEFSEENEQRVLGLAERLIV